MKFYQLLGEEWEEIIVSIEEVLFLLDVVSLQDKLIVPLHVINDVLSSGKSDAGMSGYFKWEPVTMILEEYNKFVIQLKADGFRELDAPPVWVVDYDTWHIWEQDRLHGVDSEKVLLHAERIKTLEEQIRLAEAAGETEKLDALRGTMYKSEKNHCKYVMDQIRNHRTQ